METEDLNGEKIVGRFYENELQITNQSLELRKVIKKKGNLLHTKWESYNLFNSWMYKKDII